MRYAGAEHYQMSLTTIYLIVLILFHIVFKLIDSFYSLIEQCLKVFPKRLAADGSPSPVIKPENCPFGDTKSCLPFNDPLIATV